MTTHSPPGLLLIDPSPSPPSSINDNEMCAELLLERMSPQELNCVDGGGRTVVHASAYNNSVECLSLLLRRGPEVSVVDNQGMTPLMMAAKHGHTNVVGEWCALYGVVCLKGVTKGGEGTGEQRSRSQCQRCRRYEKF